MGLFHNEGKLRVAHMQAKFCRRCPPPHKSFSRSAPHKRFSRPGLRQCATDTQISLLGVEKKHCLKYFLKEFWQSSNPFDFRRSLKRKRPSVQSTKATLAIHNTLLEVQICSFSVRLLKRTTANLCYLSPALPYKMVTLRNKVLYRIPFNAYKHSCYHPSHWGNCSYRGWWYLSVLHTW